MLKIFKYEELSEQAKETVREWYYDGVNTPEAFRAWHEGTLCETFPYSRLNLEPCGDDALRIYGRLYLRDGLMWLRGKGVLSVEDSDCIEDYISALPECYVPLDMYSADPQSVILADRVYMDSMATYAYMRITRIRNENDLPLLRRFFGYLHGELVSLMDDYRADMLTFYCDDEENMLEYIANNNYVFDEDGNVVSLNYCM